MRAPVLVLLLVLAACGGGASIEDGPAAQVASAACNRLGPDGTGFMIELEYAVTLDVGQAFTADFDFPTNSPPLNRSDIYSCGSWSNTGIGGDSQGCQRDPGQAAASQRIFHSLAIEFPDPLPSPVAVTVNANPVVAPESSTTIGLTDSETVSCM